MSLTWMQWAGVAAAVAVALWPQAKALSAGVAAWLERKAPATHRAGVGFQAAVDHLANVRLRLLQTSALEEEQKKAIETLTLALVAGSDK